ncbi:MAG: ClcB-like voltage-gated chloride channel protein [Verrucomicrobia bacterium]|nr:ClcB-like voltage-gated chloride channel protein [Verrucomicrobiota bacterium]
MQVGQKTVEQVWVKTQALLRKHWQRALSIRERLRFSEEAFHLVLAGLVGVVGGLVNFAFYTAIDLVQDVVFGRHRDLVEMAEVLSGWQRFLIPGLGGLAAGLILYWGLRFTKKQGTTNFLEVVVAGDGKLPFRSALIKATSSLMSIGTGASIGREGAITQLTAMIASKLGQFAKWQPYRLRLLVACGAASGLAAAYGAPVAGAVFAAQIVLGNFSMNMFAPVVFSSVIASIISRNFFEIQPYEVPAFTFTKITELPWFLLLGIFCGILGAGFLKMLRRSEESFKKLEVPLYAKLCLGGFLVGVIAIWYPTVWGNGYTVIKRVLTDQFSLQMLVAIFIAKMLATVITVGSGAVGGVFTPTLFLGAGLGAIFGMTLQAMGFAEALPVGLFALVGMGGVLAATTRSPLLAMIMAFELSNYSLMPALMVASVVSTLVARRLHPESIYTEPLRLKGLAAEREEAREGAALEQTIGDIMRAPVPPLKETAILREIGDRFITSPNNFLPVVDMNQRLVGVVALHDLKEYLNAPQELNAIIAYDVMRPIPRCLTPSQRLMDALPTLLASELRNIPVVNTFSEMKLVGAIARTEALGLLSEAIATSSTSEASAAKEA